MEKKAEVRFHYVLGGPSPLFAHLVESLYFYLHWLCALLSPRATEKPCPGAAAGRRRRRGVMIYGCCHGPHPQFASPLYPSMRQLEQLMPELSNLHCWENCERYCCWLAKRSPWYVESWDRSPSNCEWISPVIKLSWDSSVCERPGCESESPGWDSPPCVSGPWLYPCTSWLPWERYPSLTFLLRFSLNEVGGGIFVLSCCWASNCWCWL